MSICTLIFPVILYRMKLLILFLAPLIFFQIETVESRYQNNFPNTPSMVTYQRSRVGREFLERQKSFEDTNNY